MLRTTSSRPFVPLHVFLLSISALLLGHEQQHPSHPPPRPLPTSAQSLPLASVTTAEWNTSSELPSGLGFSPSSAVVDGRLQVVTYVEDAYDTEDPQYLLVGGA